MEYTYHVYLCALIMLLRLCQMHGNEMWDILKNVRKNTQKIEHWHVITAILIIYDMIAVNMSYFLALWLRFDFHFSAIPAYSVLFYLI